MSSTVAFIHSTGLGPFMWAPYVGCVGEAPTATPFNLGYLPGQSLQPPSRTGLADDVAFLRHQLSPHGPVHLVAHSWGATVALELARSRSLPVQSLWLYEPVLFGALAHVAGALDSATAGDLQSVLAEFREVGEEEGGRESWLRSFIDYWNGAGAWDLMSERARQAMRRVGWKMYQEVRATFEETYSFDIYRMDIPVTLVAGRLSQRPARAMVQCLAALMPQARLHDVEGLGHMGILDRPAVVEPLLRGHFAGLEVAQAEVVQADSDKA